MTRVGLVLGGGGIAGAAYQLATLMALELATGWHPNDADIIVGTSSGSSVAAAVRADRLDLDTLVQPHESPDHVADRIRNRVHRRGDSLQFRRWIRHGIAPGFRNPGLSFALGSPAPFDAQSIADWIVEQLDEARHQWPSRTTAIVAYDVEARARVAFGTINAPVVSVADAVAASSAIPLVFNPHVIEGRAYVDGGVMSGTHADLVLGLDEPLDLLIVVPPMAQPHRRAHGRFYEHLFDKVGLHSLKEELGAISREWPNIEILVLRPPPEALEEMRPNPMDPKSAVPTFVKTLDGMRNELGRPEVWSKLVHHLYDGDCGEGSEAGLTA